MQNLYIKQIHNTTEMSFTNPNVEYYICAKLRDTYHLLTEISYILPTMTIIDISNDINIFKKNFKSHFQNYTISNDAKEFMIVDNILSETYIIDVIQCLANEKTPLHNINILCIACNQNILNLIGNQYSQLKIYTTKIIS